MREAENKTEVSLTEIAGNVAGNEHGRVLPPLLLWMLGVPGGLCLILWLFFFRG